ncbi:hypothetical protein [Gordonia sp. N1V]|uniref:hypothetical protein n=1 Tax=Gordonia sp. N1V TaxID=3034163 RepID=UPI0023E229EB|nr:hypothetical protein [Gordonia sp. N1V]MDF3280940.1 hypothetical protein [Gordonia sp. N1V]
MRILRCRGIGENPTGAGTMLEGVTSQLSGYDVVEVPWAADYGPVGNGGALGIDYADSLARGVPMVRSLLDVGPAILLGYSGGAELARMVSAIGHPHLRAAGFIADPAMPVGKGVPGRSGVTGHLYALPSVPMHWEYNPFDVICQCPADSPIRTISDISGRFSATNFPAWSWDMIDRLRSARWQVLGKYLLANPVQQWQRYSQAATDAIGYLNGSQHIAAYKGSHQTLLAEWVRSVT